MMACIGINTAYALLVPSPFVSNTDKLQYDAGEIIKISGMVANSMFQPNQTMTIDVYDPNGKLYQNSTVILQSQHNPYSNGLYNYGYTYEYDMKTENKTIAGPYQIVSHYGNSGHNTNTILYNPTHVDYSKYYTFNAFFGNTPYPIRYEATQGSELQGLGMDTTNNILYINANGVENKAGHLTLELPRILIDSRFDNATDKNFTVAMGAMGAGISYTHDFQEIQSNGQSRTLQFNILPYNSHYLIMLQGTSINQTEAVKQNIILPPLKQFNSGVAIENISCREGLYLAIKLHNKEPTCLKAGTISKLASRGFLYGINANETNYTTILIPPGSENPSSKNTYSPDMATVVLGVNNTVRWVSQAEAANTIVPDMPLIQNGKSFGSDGVIKPGGSYQFTFTEPGTFAYHGEPHPWQKGTIIVLPQSNNSDILAAKTYNLKQVHYYDSSNLNPKVSLYDYSYDGIDKDGLVSIDNQTFYQTTLDNDIYKLKGVSVQFHNVTFSFPEGTLITPGGAFVNLDVKFQDDSEEIYGGTMSSPDGSSTMLGGIQIPTQYGPHLAANSVTILGNHTIPQAGLTIYHDKIKLLVSTDDKMSTENNAQINKILGIVPSCVSTMPHQYAIAGPPGDLICPYANFVVSDKILNATGFYGIYNYTSYPGTLNYVLEPGHNGTIVFLIHMGMIHHNASTIPYFNQINITNDVVFMHDAGMHNHPGVDVLVEPKSQMIRDDGTSLVTVTFSASKDALPGVYWVTLPPSFCVGGQMIILTVTDCEK